MKLKICGITRLEDARYAAAAGADYLGFIQHEKSTRYVDPDRAKEIVEWVYGPETVGVFVNASADDVNRIADAAGFSYIQLHGEEPVADVQHIERPVIKALRVSTSTTPMQLRQSLLEYVDVAEYFLLDTHSEDVYGGTGKTFDWDVARGIADDYDLFLAGGIGAENVAALVSAVRPFAVDVSSALETSPGIKDFAKIDTFMKAFSPLRATSPESNVRN